MKGGMLAPFRGTWEAALHLVYPSICAVTQMPLLEGEIAPAARELLLETASEPMCQCCGARVGPNIPTDAGCDLCRKEHYPFRKVVRLGRYEGALAEVCRRMKRSSEHRLTRALGELYCQERARELSELAADVMVVVPLHWWTELGRGSNQSATFAGPIARHLQLPLLNNVVVKAKRTTPQHYLSPTDRRANVRGAFVAKRTAGIVGKRVLLVDDILTTGSTCKEVTRVLLTAGAKEVVVGVLARGGGRQT